MNQRASFLSCMLLSMAFLWCASPAAWADDQVFISDANMLRITDIATMTPVADFPGTLGDCRTGQSGECPGFDDGKHMVVDSLGRRIFVSDHDYDFLVFDIGCDLTQIFPEFGGNLDEPLGIAPLPNGQLLITDEEEYDGLFRLNADLSLDIQTNSGSIFEGPEGVVYDAVHDRIYVADEDGGDIEIFNGTTLDHIASVAIFCNSDGAYWLGVDGSSNRLFVLADSQCYDGQGQEFTGPALNGVGGNYGIHVYNIVDGGDDLVFNQTLFGSNGGESDCYGTLAVSESTDRLFAIDYCGDFNKVDIYDTTDLSFLGTVPVDRAGVDPLMVSVGHLTITDCNNNGRDDACDIALGAGEGVGGPVIIGGDDADDHGDVDGGVNERGWLYIEDGLNLLGQNVLNGNTQAVCLGCNGDEASEAFESGFDQGNLPGAGWTRHTVTGAADIADFFAGTSDVNINTASIIYMPSDDDNVDDGITAAEIAVVNANALGLNLFVAGGGGLFTHTQEDIVGGYGWLTTLLPGLDFITDGDLGCDDNTLNLTPVGATSFPNLTDAIISNATPWHNVFQGNLGGLDILVTGPCEPQDGVFTNEAVIIGGAQVMQLGGSLDLNNNGIPDECEVAPPPGGGDITPPIDPSFCTGLTDPNGDLDCTVGDGLDDLGKVRISGADEDVSIELQLTEGETDGDPPGPGTGTFSGFGACDAFGGTLSLDVDAAPGTFKALLCLTATAADIAALQALCPTFEPEDASVHVLENSAWIPAGTNDLGENAAKPDNPSVGDFGYVVGADGSFTYFVCRDSASFYAVGVTEQPQPPAPQPPPEPPAPEPTPPPAPPTPPAPVPPPAPQTPPQDVGPLCAFCGIGCPQMMIMSFLGLAMMGFVQRRRRFF